MKLKQQTHNYSEALNLKKSRYKQWVVRYTLDEFKKDLRSGDYTTESYFTRPQKNTTVVVAKQSGVLAGVQEIIFFLRHFPKLKFEFKKKDGQKVKNGESILILTGDVRLLMKIERIILNLIGRMSGVASNTANLVARAHKSNPSVLLTPTRKTLWGLLDKRACMLGGGGTHRLSLDDAILVKHNHLKASGVSIEKFLQKSLRHVRGRFFEVEVANQKDALQVAGFFRNEVQKGIKISFCILLDNMRPDQIKKTLIKIKNARHDEQVLFEASGRINKKNISAYAKTGVDIISLGSLTHSAPVFDCTLRIM